MGEELAGWAGWLEGRLSGVGGVGCARCGWVAGAGRRRILKNNENHGGEKDLTSIGTYLLYSIAGDMLNLTFKRLLNSTGRKPVNTIAA